MTRSALRALVFLFAFVFLSASTIMAQPSSFDASWPVYGGSLKASANPVGLSVSVGDGGELLVNSLLFAGCYPGFQLVGHLYQKVGADDWTYRATVGPFNAGDLDRIDPRGLPTYGSAKVAAKVTIPGGLGAGDYRLETQVLSIPLQGVFNSRRGGDEPTGSCSPSWFGFHETAEFSVGKEAKPRADRPFVWSSSAEPMLARKQVNLTAYVPYPKARVTLFQTTPKKGTVNLPFDISMREGGDGILSIQGIGSYPLVGFELNSGSPVRVHILDLASGISTTHVVYEPKR